MTMAMPDQEVSAAGTAASVAQNFLRVIVDPSKKTPPINTEVDIVAVHGLNPTNTEDHAELTWTKGNKMWLKDFLPREVPTARVLLFGYNANVAFETSTAGVLEQAHNLLNRLRAKRRRDQAESRPVIFVAHSLGGIVVKRALVTASQVERYKAIRQATYGIVFFATPHRGGEYVTLGKTASKIVRAVLSEPKNSFLDALEKDSLFATTMIDDFRNMLEDYKVISFYETRPIPHVGIIVDNKSAMLGISSNRENAIALDLDHRSICKFDSETDDYEQVSDNIIELVEEGIKNAPASAFASPASEDSRTSLPESQVSSSIFQQAGSSIDDVAMITSINQSTQSLSLSDVTEEGDRRRSCSTAITSTPSLDSEGNVKSSQTQSPRLFSSIRMNLKDSKGYDFRTAAAEGKKDAVKEMLEKGVPIDNCGVWDGYTALAEAALHGQEAVIQLLLNEGANPAFRVISSTSKFGNKENTPLSLAAGKGHLRSMKILLDAHEYTTEEKNGAFRAAKAKNRSDAMNLIRERGGGLY